MITNKKKYFIYTIIFGSLALADLILYTIFEFSGFFRNTPHIVPYVIVLALFILIALLFSNLLHYIHTKSLLYSLRLQNEHSFGMRTFYFNNVVFDTFVNDLRRKGKYKGMNQSLIVFSENPETVSVNSSRKQMAIDFHCKAIQYLEKYFKDEKTDKKHVYCYEDGIFMIYCFGDNRMEIIHLVNVLNDKLYQIVMENQFHILVTPHFGIDEVKQNETLTEAIENASLAKKISEKNFEIFNFYQSGFRETATKDDANKILEGIQNKEFVVYYQPKFDLGRNCFISSEALIRWDSPTMGLLMPAAFVSKANAAGLSHELNMYVFDKVCQDIHENKKKGRRLLPVSMNFSLYEFYSPTFLETLITTMKKYDVDPRLIQIEILETTSQANPFLSVSTIKKLKDLGIRVLMDDFGIGYSNIGNLSKIPFDTIKIDKFYVDNIVTDRKSRQIVQCLVDLGKINGLEVIAEGVDSEEQVAILREMGCDTIQGFYYSCPLKKEEFERFLIDNPFEKEERHR